MRDVAERAARAVRGLRGVDAVGPLAGRLRARAAEIRRANDEDLGACALSAAKRDRLRIDVEATARGVEAVAALPDPLTEEVRTRPDGLRVIRRRVPFGVVLMIYEARPNVTAEAAAICLKAGNAVILKGGSEARRTNRAIVDALGAGDAVQWIDTHADVAALLQMSDLIDLVIPRGGEELIRSVTAASRIHVLKHFKGNCHVYVDAAADLEMAEKIVLNAKTQRPATCNAAEHLLVHRDVARAFLPRLTGRGIELRGDDAARAILPGIKPEIDWGAEYLDLILGVKVVGSLDEAIAHIHRHGSRHTDAIVTRDEAAARRFLDEVDSASVLWNASTRVADGGQYGLGAEIGISTDKLHARGPMGVEELTTYKWVVIGDGHVRGT